MLDQARDCTTSWYIVSRQFDILNSIAQKSQHSGIELSSTAATSYIKLGNFNFKLIKIKHTVPQLHKP